MKQEYIYTSQQAEEIARKAAQYVAERILLPANLDNKAGLFPEGDCTMHKRFRDKVTINGNTHWIGGYCNQDLYDAYVHLLTKEGMIQWVDDDIEVPLFGDYLTQFYETYKQGQQDTTVVNRDRVIKNHILPEFGGTRIDRITTSDIQRWMNTMASKYANETLMKIKHIMSPVFDAAVDDDIIRKNPLTSKHIKIGGAETIHHKAIPKEKMDEIKAGLNTLDLREMVVAALLSYTGMRLEEVLGLKWEDIYDDLIHIERAVVHPKRNLPVVKDPKTKTSKRTIPYIDSLKAIIEPVRSTGFIAYSDRDEPGVSPLSFTETRRVIDKIRKRFDINEYSAHDFRDTCATEWRENGMPLDMIARLLGHSKTETTEKRYIKYRSGIMDTAKSLMT